MTKKKLNQNILIELIDLSAGTQQRPLSPDVVTRYQELRKDGVELPPIELIYTGKEYLLWDGFHRVSVAQKLGETHIRANVEIGELRRAMFMSYHANSQHGLPRQLGDVQYIVDKFLSDSEWSKMPIAEIAQHVGCSRQYVYQRKNVISGLESLSTVDKQSSEKPETKAKTKCKTETEPKSPLKDDEGRKIPPPLADRFLSRSVIKAQINDLDKIKNSIDNSITGSEMTYALLNQTGFQNDMANLRARLKAAIPHALCSYCNAKGCGACHNSGFLNEATWKAAPKNE